MPRATGNGQSDFRMKSEMNVADIQQRSDRQDQLYAMRRMHIESLNRFANEIDDPDRFQALNEDDLAIRQERMMAHFADMERAHRLYLQVCRFASNEVYDHIETRVMNAMSRIRKRLREISSNVIHGMLGRMLTKEQQERESNEPLRAVVEALTNVQRQMQPMRQDTSYMKRTASGGEQRKESGKRFRPYENSCNQAEPCINRDKSYQRNRDKSAQGNGSTKCVVPTCQQYHAAWKCKAFFGLPLAERRKLVRKHRLCNICLSSGHLSFTCPRISAACTKCPEARYGHHYKMCSGSGGSDGPTEVLVEGVSETPK